VDRFTSDQDQKYKMITGPCYTYRRIHFTSRNASCFW